MTPNLDALKDEVLEYLEAEGFVVFRGYSRPVNDLSCVYWDTAGQPDFRRFLQAARQVDVRLIVYYARAFSTEMVDEALERLEDCELPREDHRRLERQLRELRAYDGFTCALELSFDYQARTYFFHLNAEWYEDYLDLLDEIEAAAPEQEDEDEGPVGGYFSRN